MLNRRVVVHNPGLACAGRCSSLHPLALHSAGIHRYQMVSVHFGEYLTSCRGRTTWQRWQSLFHALLCSCICQLRRLELLFGHDARAVGTQGALSAVWFSLPYTLRSLCVLFCAYVRRLHLTTLISAVRVPGPLRPSLTRRGEGRSGMHCQARACGLWRNLNCSL